jgi:AAA-like domain
MNINQVLEAVEQLILCRSLSPIERLVLSQSWLGQDYSEMARDSAYSIQHLKEIGSRLWQSLSEVLGERVTKKNLHIVVTQYADKSTQKQSTTHSQLLSITNTENKPNFSATLINSEIKFLDGSLTLDSPFYINRPPIEELAYAEIACPGCLLRIKAPRQMGKSSLLNRILFWSQELEYKTAYVDFQEADATVFESLDKFLRWFASHVTRQLNLAPILDEFWDEDMGSKTSCKVYFESYLLEQIDSPIVLALNEVNRVFEHANIAQDFLPMLRFWHELARQSETWQKLRLVVVYSTEIYIPLKLNQSPFNVGLSIKLTGFSLEQVQDLAIRYGLRSDRTGALELMAMVGGHPYLVNVALYHLSRQEMTLPELLKTAATPAGIYSHHLRGLLAILREEWELAAALKQVVTAKGSVKLEAIAAYKLESMGLLRLEGNLASPSCQLYRLYFGNQLEETNNCPAERSLYSAR